MPPHELSKTFRSFTHSGDSFSPETTSLLVEAPLEIIINNDRHILIMFTPEMTKELVTGFIFTEGLIRSLKEIEGCMISSDQKEDGTQVIEARVTLSAAKHDPLSNKLTKRISYSSCGICGKENYYELSRGLGRVKSRHRFSMDLLKGLPRRLKKLQPLYNSTGGAHAAMLFDAIGNIIFHCEDMGRHNALDKVIGYTLLNGIPVEDKILVSSGRASLEMILKTARVGFPVFVANSRPTSRAVEAAKFYNITLIDMARDSNHIYTHVRRIEGF
jgi:FdhD protein